MLIPFLFRQKMWVMVTSAYFDLFYLCDLLCPLSRHLQLLKVEIEMLRGSNMFSSSLLIEKKPEIQRIFYYSCPLPPLSIELLAWTLCLSFLGDSLTRCWMVFFITYLLYLGSSYLRSQVIDDQPTWSTRPIVQRSLHRPLEMREGDPKCLSPITI